MRMLLKAQVGEKGQKGLALLQDRLRHGLDQ